MKLKTLAAISAILLATASPLHAKLYRVIVPTNPGSTHDVIARTIVDKMNDKDDTFIIENVFGSGGDVGLQKAVQYAQGKTPVIYFSFDDTFAFNPYNKAPLSFNRLDVLRFMQPVVINDQMLLVRDSLKINTVAELVKYAKEKKEPILVGEVGELSIATNHSFAKQSGFNMVLVRYRNLNDMLLALQRGDIDYTFSSFQPNFPTVGGIKMIATSNGTRYTKFPEIPTLKELGYKDLVVHSYHMWSVPIEESAEIPALEKKISKAMQAPEVKKVMDTFLFSTETELNTDQMLRDMLIKREADYRKMMESSK